MLTSKITSKGQVTIPKEVRARLKVKAGDVLAYEFRNDGVLVRRVSPLDRTWHAALSTTLTEWASEEDEQAFRDL